MQFTHHYVSRRAPRQGFCRIYVSVCKEISFM